MVTISTNQNTITNIWEKPNLVIRVIDNAETTSNRANGLVGVIDPNLIPIEYTIAPGPEGSSLKVRDKTNLFLSTIRELDEEPNLIGKTITLENRQNAGDGNRLVQNILMRGAVSAVENNMSVDNNGISYDISEWYWTNNAPCRLVSTGKTVGGLLSAIQRGVDQEINVFQGRPFIITTPFPQPPFLADADGATMGQIDPELLTSNIFPNKINVDGMKIGPAFCEIVKAAWGGNRLPIIKYTDRGIATLTTVEKGAQKKYITIGNVADPDPSTSCGGVNVQSISGSSNYDSVVNRAFGVGGRIQISKSFTLQYDWTEEEENICRLNPALLSTPRYSHVFRRYKCPRKIYNVLTDPRNYDERGDFYEDNFTFYVKPDFSGNRFDTSDLILPEQETPTEYPDWTKRDLDYVFERGRVGQQPKDLEKFTLNNISDVFASRGAFYRISFKDPMIYKYYTRVQEAIQKAGGEAGNPLYTSVAIKIDAVEAGPFMETDTGYLGDLPLQRTDLIQNDYMVEEQFVNRHSVAADGSITEVTNLGRELRDDSTLFQNQLASYINERQRPSNDYSIVLWYYDPDGYELGDVITEIRNPDGDVVKYVEWYVQKIKHDLQTWKTTLYVSNNFNHMLASYLSI